MRVLILIKGHVIYNPAYTYKFQMKTTILLSKILNQKQCDYAHFFDPLGFRTHTRGYRIGKDFTTH